MEIIENSTVKNRTVEQSDISLGDIWGMIWGYKWWYVAILAIALAAAALYLYKTPTSFKTTAKVIINEDNQEASLRDLASISGGNRRPSMNVNNEVEAFLSPDLMQTVVERLRLQTSYVEHQFLRTRELYQYSPIELTVAEQRVPSAFSFSVEKLSDSTFVMKDFTVGNE